MSFNIDCLFTESITQSNNSAWKTSAHFTLPPVSSLSLIDLKSEKPALKHLRQQFCLSLVSDDEELNKGEDSPMEIKNYFPSPFVRHGFGRVSTTSSSYQGSDHPNCIEEMDESGSDQRKITVQHCISKYNKNVDEMEKTTSKIILNSEKHFHFI